MRKYICQIILSILFIGCNNSATDGLKTTKNKNDGLKTTKNKNDGLKTTKNKDDGLKTTKNKESIIRIVVGGDSSAIIASIFEDYYNQFGNKEKNHIFFDPRNRNQQLYVDIANSSKYVVIHETEETSLLLGIETVIKDKYPQSIVIYLGPHGAPSSGNLCYTNEKSCLLSGKIFASLFRNLNIDNLKKPPNERIERIALIIPSCYSKLFAEQLQAELGNSITTFALSMVSLKETIACRDDDIAAQIFLRRITILDDIKKNFYLWVNKDDSLNRLFNLHTIEQYVNILNELAELNNKNLYQAIEIAGKNQDMDLNKLELLPAQVVIWTDDIKEYDSRYDSNQFTAKPYDIAQTVLKSKFLVDRVTLVVDPFHFEGCTMVSSKEPISFNGDASFVICFPITSPSQ